MPQGIRPVLSVSRVVFAVLLAGALVACSSPDPAPEPSPTVEPTTAAPTPDPEPADELPDEPEMPVPASGTPDERDAEAAAEYFVRLYEYTLATGDLTTWDARSMDDCGFCASTAEDVRGFNEAGISYEGGEIEPGPARFLGFDDVFVIYAIEVPYSIAAAQLVGADGDVTRTFEAESGFLVLEVGYNPATGWMLQTGSAREESAL